MPHSSADFDRKLIGGRALRWILEQGSTIWAAPARRQSSNGLVERTWQTLVRMARSYISEKQVGREYWFYAIKHAAHMLNQVPGRLGRKLTSPFELVYNAKPDSKTLFELFSVGYFPVDSKSGEKASLTESHTMHGIAIGRDDSSNTITFYNPITRKCYSPPTFKLDFSSFPNAIYPRLVRYDGGFVCGPLRNNTDPVPEPFPPGTRVNVKQNNVLVRGTVQNIPIPFTDVNLPDSSPDDDADSPSPLYTVQLDDGTLVELKYEELHLKPQKCTPHSMGFRL